MDHHLTNQIELIAIEINSSTDDTECEQYMSQYNSNFPLINGQNSYYYGYEAYYTPTFTLFSRMAHTLIIAQIFA